MNADKIELMRMRRQEILAVEESMAEVGRACCLVESVLEDLRGLARATVEFAHYLQGPDSRSFEDPEENLNYVCLNTLGGLGSFFSVNDAYRVLVEATESTLVWSDLSPEALKEMFAAKYREFLDEPVLETRCRPLLDLFKLQIVFAGVSYR